MAEKRKYPIAGTDFFTKIVDEHGYYIDKTDVIPWLLSRSKQVVLFTRPRRFGKSTMMSMLKAFFEYRIDRSNIESNIEYGSGRLDLAVWRKDRAYLLKLKSISLSELKKLKIDKVYTDVDSATDDEKMRICTRLKALFCEALQ